MKNKIIIYKGHAEIVLYDRNRTEKARTKIDLDDVERIRNHQWCCKSNGYVGCSTLNKKLHRYLLDAPKHKEVDHINHNKMDNRKINLRMATRSQNAMNNNSKGVYYDKGIKKWRAYIGLNNKDYHIGCYNNIEEAKEARQQEIKKHFREFANA